MTASSSSSEAESDWQVYTYTSTPPSPTESEIDWVSVPSVPALQVNQDTSPPLDVDYDPYEEEDYMSQGPIDEDDEYYAYWTDHGEDDGDDDGDDNGNNNGGGDDNDDDDIDPNNNYWSIADQIRVLGETYDEYCEHWGGMHPHFPFSTHWSCLAVKSETSLLFWSIFYVYLMILDAH